MGMLDADRVDDVEQVLGVHGQDVGGGEHFPGKQVLHTSSETYLRRYLLSILGVDSGVQILLGQLHGMYEFTHILGEHLVSHFHLGEKRGNK